MSPLTHSLKLGSLRESLHDRLTITCKQLGNADTYSAHTHSSPNYLISSLPPYLTLLLVEFVEFRNSKINASHLPYKQTLDGYSARSQINAFTQLQATSQYVS